jgi:GNAT superfamily N-acetyltransferase
MGYPGDFFRAHGATSADRHDRSPAPADDGFRWIPIRSLASHHRPRILSHLLSLNESDRYLRFGYPASDEQIERYVEHVDFDRDEVFGIFNRRLEVIALAHLAYLDRHPNGYAMAEFGVSVLPRVRGRGYGARLFDHAVLHARNRCVDTLFIQALSENTAMLRIARNAGARVQREGAESEAVLKLPPDDIASHVGQMLEDRAAELDYRLKVQARKMDALVRTVAKLKAQLAKVGRAAES